MKNKYKLLLAAAGICIVLSVIYFFGHSEIIGSATKTKPQIHSTILKSDVLAIPEGEGKYRLYQKYQVGKNESCVQDCREFCASNGFEFYTAYVRKWGECMCKYTLLN